MKQIILIFCCILIGCANPKIVEISPDTYVLFRDDHAGIFGNAGSLRAGVINDANEFAKKKGKIAIPVSSTYTPMGNGPAQWASFEYQFRVVAKSDEEAVRTSLNKRANFVLDKNINVKTNSKSEFTIDRKDTYSELLKIKDLLEKEIITIQEFNMLKAKILNQ